MVIEHFNEQKMAAMSERFQTRGRMLPAEVNYQASWIEETGARCFQVMDAPSEDALHEWTRRWEDLVEFEIVPVLTSADYWATRTGQ